MVCWKDKGSGRSTRAQISSSPLWLACFGSPGPINTSNVGTVDTFWFASGGVWRRGERNVGGRVTRGHVYKVNRLEGQTFSPAIYSHRRVDSPSQCRGIAEPKRTTVWGQRVGNEWELRSLPAAGARLLRLLMSPPSAALHHAVVVSPDGVKICYFQPTWCFCFILNQSTWFPLNISPPPWLQNEDGT